MASGYPENDQKVTVSFGTRKVVKSLLLVLAVAIVLLLVIRFTLL